MTTATRKFSPIKTIKLIYREPLLSKVFNSDGEHTRDSLLKQATADSLPVNVLATLEGIYENAIITRTSFIEEYDKVVEVDKTPRRYGKVKIQEDIVDQGGISTEIQKTMLALNDLKSMWMNLDGKGVSDHYRHTSKITDEEGKIIRAAIRTFRNKTQDILSKKK